MDTEDIDSKINDAVSNLETEILKFKKELYSTNVSDNTNYNASSINPMIIYHTLFLQSITYWMALINSQAASKPNIQNPKLFNKISDIVKTIANYNSDSKILVYNSLIKFSRDSAFDMSK